MKIIDTHQHLWDLDKFSYSWCAGLAPLNRSFRLDDYRAAAREADVAGTVHVEADVDEAHLFDETRWISELAAQPDSPIRGIVAAVRPERADFAAQLERLQDFSLVKGVRRVLHTQPDELWQAPLFARNLRLLPDHDLSFDLCVLARQLPLALEMVRQCAEVRFVLDHCGVPDVGAGALEPWREHLLHLAALPNVACKVSGLVAHAGPDWAIEELRPFVAHALEVFGPERVMWGSDWPVCTLTSSFGQWLQAAHQLTAARSEEEPRQLFHDNAVRLYRL